MHLMPGRMQGFGDIFEAYRADSLRNE
jgi:hypothetical protein